MSERERYSDRDMAEVADNPEWSDNDIKRARPFAETFPQHAAAARKRGPARTKEAVSIRLDIDLLQKLRDSGPGWQSRVNDALREWIEKSAA